MYTSVPGSSHVCLQDSCILVKAQFFLFLDYILFCYTTGLACLLTNSAAENTLVPVFGGCVLICLGLIPRVELLAHRVYVYLAFPDTAKHFFVRHSNINIS